MKFFFWKILMHKNEKKNEIFGVRGNITTKWGKKFSRIFLAFLQEIHNFSRFLAINQKCKDLPSIDLSEITSAMLWPSASLRKDLLLLSKLKKSTVKKILLTQCVVYFFLGVLSVMLHPIVWRPKTSNAEGSTWLGCK